MNFPLVLKLVTLNDLSPLFYVISQKSGHYEPTTSQWLMLDSKCLWQKCSF